ncbi:hypothetical protein YH62_09015 [Rhizobium sp. LC145]|jgi:hypothetical protein|nr:hypothetical protein YH62_09015 [Rhizobium sp. LC145]
MSYPCHHALLEEFKPDRRPTMDVMAAVIGGRQSRYGKRGEVPRFLFVHLPPHKQENPKKSSTSAVNAFVAADDMR